MYAIQMPSGIILSMLTLRWSIGSRRNKKSSKDFDHCRTFGGGRSDGSLRSC